MRFTIKLTLMTLTVALGTLVGASFHIAKTALHSAKSTAHDVLEEPFRHTVAIGDIIDAYAVKIVDASHKARNGNMSISEALDGIREAQQLIDERWASLVAFDMEGEELAGRERVAERRRIADAAVADLVNILEGRNEEALATFTIERLYQVMDPLSAELGNFALIQRAEANEMVVEIEDTVAAAIMKLLWLGAVAIVVVAGTLAIIYFKVVRPLGACTSSLEFLAKGELSSHVPNTGRNDELGDIARAVDALRNGLLEAATQRVEALRDLANDIEREMRSAVGEIASIGGAMAESAQSMTRVASRVNGNAGEVANAAAETLSTTQTVAAAVEELAASSREIGSQAANTTAVVRQVSDAGARTRETFGSLVAAASRIGDVTKLISEIAGKTSLLALNATIESARAGEAGKGFAVVANEVKALAAQTAKATEDIGTQIAEIQQATSAAADALDGIGREIETMNAVSTSVAAAVEEQVVATEEISRNVAHTATASHTVNERIGEVSREAGEAERHADEVGNGAVRMVASIETLQQTLVRAVRTSSSDVERRMNPRHTANVTAELNSNGRTGFVTLEDISLGGARLKPTDLVERGTTGTLKLPHFNAPLPFVCLARGREGVHVRFDIDDAMRGRLGEALAMMGVAASA